jgi:hypothetical protein
MAEGAALGPNRRPLPFVLMSVEEIADEAVYCSTRDVRIWRYLLRSIESKPGADKRRPLGKRLDNAPFLIHALARISGRGSHNR